MRILHLSSLYPPHVHGGAEKVAAMLAEGQAAQGHEVAVASLVPTPSSDRELNGVTLFPVTNSNLCWVDDLVSRPGAVRMANKLMTITNPMVTHAVAKAVRDWQPDVVHSHSMAMLPPTVWRAAANQGAAVVHTLHDYDLLCSVSTLFRGGHNCGQKRRAICSTNSGWKGLFVSKIDHIVGVSRAVLGQHIERGLFTDWAPERRHVVHNATPLKPRARPARAADAPFTFGFLGRLVPEKGIGMLIDACRQMANHDWRLRVGGEAPEDSPFRAQAAGLPVEFCGFVDTGAFLDSIDVLIVPSIWQDPYPTVILEAKAAGVPTIGSQRGGIPEAIGDEGCGWTYDPDAPGALAARMEMVRAAGRAALPSGDVFVRALEAMAVPLMRDAYLDIYSQAIAGRRDSSARKAG
jgi:glycogen(starch) synthase